MSGCQNCSCGKAEEKKAPIVCLPTVAKISLDREGKCPCGKLTKDCCHKDEPAKDSPAAIAELCGPHGDKQIC